MNYGYIKAGDKVLVVEEDDVISIRDNCGDIKNVLALENQFDDLNFKLLDIKDEQDYYLDKYNEQKVLSFSIPAIGIILPFIGDSISNVSANFNTAFTVSCLLIGALYAKNASTNAKKNEKCRFLIEKLNVEMGNILRNIKNRSDFVFTSFDNNSSSLEDVPSHLSANSLIDDSYCSAELFANNKAKLYRLYLEGKLEQFLEYNGCSDEDILIFKNLFGEESVDSSSKILVK